MTMANVPNLVPALPEIFMAVAAMALLMLGVFRKTANADDAAASVRLIGYNGVLVLVLTAVLVFTVSGPKMVTFNGMFITDQFAVFFKVLMLLASIGGILMSMDFFKRQGVTRFEYPVLILLATLGMMMMVSANDLLSLYMGLELQSLSLYVLASFLRDDLRSSEAGMKYFVLGALASGMLLYGMSLIYGFTGSTSFDALAKHLSAPGEHGVSMGVVFGIVFMLAGLAFKVSAVPFHMWTPDVYEGAPTPVTAFFAVGPKIAAIALFLRLMIGPFGGLIEQWQQIVVFISMASMIVGAFAAIAQTNIKRMMAYSSIGHVGYALIGLAVGDAVGVRGVMVYMAIYLFMNLGAFAVILTMCRGRRNVEGIKDLAGLGKSNPVMAAIMTMFMFSMAGIPPLAGFFGKLYIFLAAIDAQLYTLAIVGVLTSVVGSFYYLRIIKVMYFDESDEAFDKGIGIELSGIMAVSLVVVLLFFVAPSPLISAAEAAAAALFGA